MARPTSTSATLQQVADAAGVSLATASRVLHGSGGRRVTTELAERVTDAANRLRYVAHAQAQALARASTHMVGLLVHDIADPYFAAIASGAMAVAREHDLMVLVANTFRDPVVEADYLSRLRAQRAQAVLLAGSAFTRPGPDDPVAMALAAFLETGGKAVGIGPRSLRAGASETDRVDAVLPGNYPGARALTEHLLARGHRHVGIITGPRGLVTTDERLAGVRRALARHRKTALGDTAGRPAAQPVPARPIVVTGDFTRDGGYEAARWVLTEHPEVTALIALNDLMAAGALRAARELGLAVPKQLAIAGFDDLPVAEDVTPALTTVRLGLAEIGATAMRLLLDPTGEPRQVEAPWEVVVRAST